MSIYWLEYACYEHILIIFFHAGQFVFPTYLSRLECRWGDIASWGIPIYYLLHLLGAYFDLLIDQHNAATVAYTPLDSVFHWIWWLEDGCLIFRELKCMDLGIGLKLQNMLEPRANHNVLITIMLYTWTLLVFLSQ